MKNLELNSRINLFFNLFIFLFNVEVNAKLNQDSLEFAGYQEKLLSEVDTIFNGLVIDDSSFIIARTPSFHRNTLKTIFFYYENKSKTVFFYEIFNSIITLKTTFNCNFNGIEITRFLYNERGNGYYQTAWRKPYTYSRHNPIIYCFINQNSRLFYYSFDYSIEAYIESIFVKWCEHVTFKSCVMKILESIVKKT